MTIPVNLFFWFICTIPIILLLVLMIIFQWGASRAAPVTLLVTCILGFTVFEGTPSVIGSELLKASWSSMGIIFVILTAILLYEIGIESHAFDVLNRLFTQLAPNELIRILMIGICFASFLQGITGFGVPVLIVAPLLLAIGVAPVYTVMIPLLGHSWAGTYGTLALGWKALLIQTKVEDPTLIFQTAVYASLLLFVLTSLFNVAIVWMYGRTKALKKSFLALVIISVVQGIGQLVMALYSPELAVVIPSILSLCALILLSKTPYYRSPWKIGNSRIMIRINESPTTPQKNNMFPFQAILPYIAITGLSLVVLLIKPIKDNLEFFSFGPSFKQTQTGYGIINTAIDHYVPFSFFTHVSSFLLVTSLFIYGYYRKKNLIERNCLAQLIQKSFKKTLSPGIAIFSLLCISRVMAGTGQTYVLAQGISTVLKERYIFISPFIGLLGSFITGSNMTSNILFGEFQLHVSEYIGLKSSLILGAQTAGGGIGTSIGPGNIILGTTTAGILGSEGKVLIKLIPYTVVAAAIFGLLLYLNYKWL